MVSKYCAGYHIGHFQEMVSEMQKMSPLSVQQVSVFWKSLIRIEQIRFLLFL